MINNRWAVFCGPTEKRLIIRQERLVGQIWLLMDEWELPGLRAGEDSPNIGDCLFAVLGS